MTELLPIWRILLRRWWVILLPPLVIGALSLPQLLGRSNASGGFVTSFKYSAAQDSSNIAQRDGDFQDIWLASEFVVNAFTEWIRSSSFRQELAFALGDSVDLSTLGIASDNARSVGVVQMSHPDGAQLETIVNTAITVLQTKNALYFPHLGETNAPVTVLDAPVVTPAPPPLLNRFEPLFRIGLALMAGLFFAVFLEVLDSSIRYPDEVERTGITVLAKIPKS